MQANPLASTSSAPKSPTTTSSPNSTPSKTTPTDSSSTSPNSSASHTTSTPPTSSSPPGPPHAPHPRDPPNLESLTTAIQKRAEKKRLHNLSRIASHQIAIERSALYPKIDAFVSTRTRHSDPPSTRPSFFQTTQEIAFGILARWDIFDGFLAQGKILQAQAQADIAATQETQWLQHTHAQARLLTSEILSLHYILQKQQQNVSLAKQALDLAQDSHAHGQLSLLDLLQANLDFTRARLHELKSLHRLLVAYTQLDRLIGHPPIHIHPSSLKISQQ
ncbi:MAG: TolC family protein [Verrucomicrobiae bacterium]|nr:TolC family protein [Verrucomicrobiae bacterium]